MDDNSTMKKFSDSYEQIPSDDVWKKISARLDGPQKKKRGWFIWSIVSVLMIAGLSSWLLIQNPDGTKKSKQDVMGLSLKKDPTPIDPPENKFFKTGKTIYNHQNTSTHTENNFSASLKKHTVLLNKNNEKQEIIREYKKMNVLKKETRHENNTPLEKPGQTATTILLSNSGIMERRILASTFFYIPGYVPEFPLAEPIKNIDPEKKSLSKWSIVFLYGRQYEGHTSVKYSTEENNHEKGIMSPSFKLLLKYDIDPRLRIATGINYHKSGMETNRSEIHLVTRNPGVNGEDSYAIPTSIGNLNGSAHEFESIYFNSPDSILFPPLTAVLPTGNDSVRTLDFVLRSEFRYLSIPIEIEYHLMERKLTPYVSAGFTAGYLLADKRYVNGEELKYAYDVRPHNWVFSLTVLAGVSYHLNRRMNLELLSSYSHGINSVTSANKWIPYSIGFSGGMSLRLVKNK